MSFDRATVEIIQVDRPPNGWCDSGHRWHEGATWQKLPELGPELIVFFNVRTPIRQMTVCEPCLVLAQNMAQVRDLARAKGK